MFLARRGRLAVCCVASGLVLHLTLATDASADLAQVRKTGTLRVAAVDGAPAFFSFKQGNTPGLEREILEGFCRLQRLNCRMESSLSPAAGLGALARGEIDLAVGGLIADPSVPGVEFSAEVMPSRL